MQDICTPRSWQEGEVAKSIFFFTFFAIEPKVCSTGSKLKIQCIVLYSTPAFGVQPYSTQLILEYNWLRQQSCLYCTELRKYSFNKIVKDQAQLNAGADKVRREKVEKNGIWREQQLSSIIPQRIALFSSEGGLYLAAMGWVWTINRAACFAELFSAHLRIQPVRSMQQRFFTMCFFRSPTCVK